MINAQQGDRVFHTRYGEGVVITVKMVLKVNELEVKWDHGSTGRVLEKDCIKRKHK